MTMLLSFKSRLVGSFQIPCLITILLLCAHVAYGQAQPSRADSQVTVKDSTRAVVANATGAALSPATNTSRNTTTNDEGFYRHINLPPGEDEITVEAPKFKKAVLPNVVVTIG